MPAPGIERPRRAGAAPVAEASWGGASCGPAGYEDVDDGGLSIRGSAVGRAPGQSSQCDPTGVDSSPTVTPRRRRHDRARCRLRSRNAGDRVGATRMPRYWHRAVRGAADALCRERSVIRACSGSPRRENRATGRRSLRQALRSCVRARGADVHVEPSRSGCAARPASCRPRPVVHHVSEWSCARLPSGNASRLGGSAGRDGLG